MPEVTVAMPARNAAEFIGQAIASVQQQTDICWELIVVDDASQDETANVVRRFNNPRIRLLTNDTRRGIGYCHNRVLAASRAPFVAHLDADDFILPGALRKMVQALQDNPRAGQAHCQFYDIDRDGNVSRARLLERVQMYRRRGQHMDYRRELTTVGSIASGLRTYPRAVFEQVGGFNEKLEYGEDWEMALRIADRYEIAFVSEFLYARRLHAHNTTETLSFKRWRLFWKRCQIARALAHSQQVKYFQQKPYTLYWLLLHSLANTLEVWHALRLLKKIPIRRSRLRASLRDLATPLLSWLYELAVNHGEWWRLHTIASNPIPAPSSKKIGYYLWRFPTLSETFIRREVQALREAGLDVQVFADEPGGVEDARLVPSTHYLPPRDVHRLARAEQYFARYHPVRYWRAFVYVVLHRYGWYKTWQEDVHVFERAVDLAYVLHENHIAHVHAPWADRTAFIALVAANLCGSSYSVQARAHDLHRTRFQYALREKFGQAAFVVTNSNYNARAIETYFDSPHPPRIHVIREFLPLEQFQPRARETVSTPFQVLCVARPVEEKGLVYLLRACDRLRARGASFHCDVIGAPESAASVYWIQLKRLHRQLRLGDCVGFQGAQPFEKVLEAYANADLFVLPCVIARNGGRDISPNALLEAMAMGLPVISTHLSAIPEIVEDGVSGLLVPPDDAEALADAMLELMQDPARRRSLGAAARQRVEQQYAADKNVWQFVALFQ